MAATYPGNRLAAQSPGVTPGPGQIPTASIPANADGATWDNIQQLTKEAMDWGAYFNTPGGYGEFRESWFIAAPSTLTATTAQIADLQKRWDYNLSAVDATQTANWQDPLTNYGARSVLLNLGTANASHRQNLNTHYAITRVYALQRISFECDFQATSSTGGASSHPVQFGLASTANASIPDLGAFYWDPGSANWQTGPSGSVSDSGVSVSIGGAFVRFKFVIDLTSQGPLASPTTSYYINDTRVGLYDQSHIPANGTNVFPTFAGIQTSGTCSATLGEIVVRWSKF